MSLSEAKLVKSVREKKRKKIQGEHLFPFFELEKKKLKLENSGKILKGDTSLVLIILPFFFLPRNLQGK